MQTMLKHWVDIFFTYFLSILYLLGLIVPAISSCQIQITCV